MTITNRNLAPGTKLEARYKGHDYTAIVIEINESIRYQLADGRDFKTPSGAGSAIRVGKATNGWAFWSIAAENGKAPQSEMKKRTAKAKVSEVVIQRMDDGRYFCNACQDAFDVPGDIEPLGCPKGHERIAA